ncbi:acyltransferase family protein [Streptomyces sp. NBC_00212]|uniref:acyltransferase family protein n=1 Tax=Streptomyces sp. NBC_00212 TaxID=2975684 RepID=UPI00324DFEDE
MKDPVPTPSPSQLSQRSAFFDNAKVMLVVLVVLGHGWEQIITVDAPVLRALHNVVYAFHMPAFILLSGYFSKSFTGRPDQIRRLVTGVLLPYLIFNALYAAAYYYLRGAPFSTNPAVPVYLCWFLIALFLWRLTAPLWNALRHPVATAVVISLAAGAVEMGQELAMARVLMFLPWFVVGLRMRPDHFARLRTAAARCCAVVVFAVSLCLARVLSPAPSDDWLSMSSGYSALHSTPLHYLLGRLALFALSAALVASFFSLVPGRRMRITALGAVTLYPYLLHGLLIRAAEKAGVFLVLMNWGPAGTALLTAAVVPIVLFLSAAPVRALARPLVEPRLPRWLAKPTPSPARRARPEGSPEPLPTRQDQASTSPSSPVMSADR